MIRAFVFSLACAVSLLANSSESFFGTYKSKNSKLPVKFILEDKGISFFEALGHTYNVSDVNIDYLGMFGNSEVLQIKYTDIAGQECVIKLFAVVINNKIQLVTGYFVNFRLSEDNSFLIRRLTPIELRFTPEVYK
jgi:hypothetical protein